MKATKKRNCQCRYRFCCDPCYRRAAKVDPCSEKGCKNPSHHRGPHGPEIQDQDGRVLVFTEQDLLGDLLGEP